MENKIDFNKKLNDMPIVTAYFSASIRGEKGSAASQAEIDRNILAGKKMAGKISRFFGDILDMYVPHNQDELIQILWRAKKISVWDILNGDCAIVASRNILLVWAENGFISTGMRREIDEAKKTNIPTLVFEKFDKDTTIKILNMIYDILKEKEKEDV